MSHKQTSGLPNSDLPTSELESRPANLRIAYLGFGLIFVAALVLWAGFGSFIFADFATFVRSCF